MFKHSIRHTSLTVFWAIVLCFMATTSVAQTVVIDVNNYNGGWHEWNSNTSSPLARSWYSSTHPGLSVCCKTGGNKTHDIRGNEFNAANNIGLWDNNNLAFYNSFSSSSNSNYEIMVADGWHITAIEFDFNSSVEDVIGVKLGEEDEVQSSSPSDTKHVSMSTTDESIHSVGFTVYKEGSLKGYAQTSNFQVTIVRDAGLMDNYDVLLIEAKTQLLGALKLANAMTSVNTSTNFITSASQFSSPYTETLEGSYEALLDGNPSTFWHSKWSNGSVPNHTHYLQVNLTAPIDEEIAMTFTRRPVINDHITVWSVYGSNDPDGDDWGFLSYIYAPYTSNTETITSLPFETYGYQHLRFYIDGTTTGRGYGHISEFQLNPASLNVNQNATYLAEAILLGIKVGEQNLMDRNDIGWDEYNELAAANTALREKFVYSFEVDGIYYKTNSLTDPTVSVSYQGNTYWTYANEYTGDVVIPETVTYNNQTYTITAIDEYAFAGCSGLTSVTIPGSVTGMGDSAFSGCTGLTTVTIDNANPPTITATTFQNPSSITLEVPAGSESAYEADPYWGAFGQIGDPMSANIVFADADVKERCVANWDTDGDGELSYSEAAAVTDLGLVFNDESDVTNNIMTFDELQYFTGLTEIGERAFMGCRMMTSITLPSNVTNIANSAFETCYALTSVTIPSSVTSIGEKAFMQCKALTSVSLTNGLTEIGNHAFDGCSNLTSITIPSSVTSIGEGIFAYCGHLGTISVEAGNTVYDSRNDCNAIIESASNTLIAGCSSTIIPNDVTAIGNYALCGCRYAHIDIPNSVITIGDYALISVTMGSITLSNNLTTIGAHAFSGCSNLIGVPLPNSLTTIGEKAFSSCNSLTDIVFPNSLTTIGDEAFSGSGLTSISIPSSVTTIGEGAFAWCTHVNSIVVENGNPVYDSREGCNALIETATNTLLQGCKNSVLPQDITSIGYAAFAGLADLTSITIPSSVVTIGREAFAFTGLTGITIPNGVVTIDEDAFEQCPITEVTIPNSVTTIRYEAFFGCMNLANITIGYGIDYIGAYAFITMGSNPNVKIYKTTPPTNGDVNYAFGGNILYVPYGCKAAYEAAGYTNWFNEIIEFDEPIVFADANVKALCVANWDTNGDGELSYSEAAAVTDLGLVFNSKITITSFDELQYFTGLTGIGDLAFFNCSDLTSVTIGNNVTSIGYQAFYGCSSLTSVTIPSSVTSIGDYAFLSCYGLTSVTIPSSVTNIGSHAFNGCYGLTSVTIPSSVASIGGDVFSNCFGLTSISVENGNTVYDSRDNCNAIIHTATKTLLVGCKNTVIPNSVTSIGHSAFWGCYGLTSVTIPNSVTYIGFNTFFGCSNLTSVTVDIATPLTITENTFSNRANATLYVPKGCKAAYEAADYWKEFKEIVEIIDPNAIIEFADANVKAICVTNWDTNGDGELSYGEAAAVTTLGEVFKNNEDITSFNELQYFTGLTSINYLAFKDCSNLAAITLPNSVTAIGTYAFWDCYHLTAFVIPNNVTTIHDHAFYGCGGLTALTIPTSVTSIGQHAFAYTRNLNSINVENGNPVYDSREGCNAIIETATNTLIQGCNTTVIPNTVTSIGSWAFLTYKNLTSVTIPNGVTSIGEMAFSECSGLTSITIPSSVTSIGTEAFTWCRNLVSISVEDGNPVYDSRNDCNAIIETATNTLITGIKSSIIPNSVTGIGDYAFHGNGTFTTIDIPNSVTNIGVYAFGHNELVSVTIPNSVTTIGNSAFSVCASLVSLSIPSSVTTIGNMAFSGCINLTSVTVDIATPLDITENTFWNRDNATLYVPKGCKAAYEAAQYWNEFKEIVELRGDVNGDGLINLSDKEALIEWLLDYSKDNTYEEVYDVNNDGKVDVRDALRILEIIAGQQ